MAIPDYQTLMLPLLKFTSDKKEHSLREAVERLSSEFSLTDQERSTLLLSGQQTVIHNRVGWARTYMKKVVFWILHDVDILPSRNEVSRRSPAIRSELTSTFSVSMLSLSNFNRGKEKRLTAHQRLMKRQKKCWKMHFRAFDKTSLVNSFSKSKRAHLTSSKKLLLSYSWLWAMAAVFKMREGQLERPEMRALMAS